MARPASETVRSLRWTIRSRLSEHPRLYLPLARRKYPNSVIGNQTELVIDGFTRSAVTFATIAFQLAQRRPVRVAHTLHAAGHVVEAVHRGVPTIVTVREPEETVLSAVIREPYLTLDQALSAYTRFYTRIQPLRAGLVIGRFEEVTSDLGSVIRRVNERFRTRFDEFEHDPANVERCYRIIEDRSQRPPWSEALGAFECGLIGIGEYDRAVAEHHAESDIPADAVPETRVQRPSLVREAMKQDLREELHRSSSARRLEVARSAYEAFVSG